MKLTVPIIVKWDDIEEDLAKGNIVKVIRCGYCKHLTHSPHKWYCSINRKVVGRDDYCSDGERE